MKKILSAIFYVWGAVGVLVSIINLPSVLANANASVARGQVGMAAEVAGLFFFPALFLLFGYLLRKDDKS